ncbi:MAG: AbrB/MazE/SpoVT family DNA-binding domain-containing protein [Candidatus Saccharibacteria bacterium]
MFDKVKFYGSATVGTKGQIVIPVEARADLNIKEGDKVIVVRAPHGGGLMVLKADMLEEIIAQTQAKLGSFAQTAKNIQQAIKKENI